jgi:predicted nucleotidyltransferase
MGYIVIEAADLPPRWRERCVAWAQSNDAVGELWLFGSRGPKGGARADSDVDLGLVLIPKIGDHDWALGNYAALVGEWRADLEAIVERHVSLVPMVAGNEGNAIVRSTGECLWRRRP